VSTGVMGSTPLCPQMSDKTKRKKRRGAKIDIQTHTPNK
jgi:hypothetical protein